ncbi:oligosaccharide flippase family protein [Salinimicrobium sp. HB62]|uniref:oligosaccharide flippase family protein n=1 Tax=Salinimicrobium sp. HB62 TaxID=3077781 RepID=UPI002D78C9ED|nr:oligosaccharide flippase family protein [Salinimicrobium sp. HB62]
MLLTLKNIKHKIFRGETRSVKAKKNISLMFLIKGISILLNLAFVPLLIDVLDTEIYGIWLTVTTIVGWIGFFDIGLGHGLRNKLGAAIAEGKEQLAKSYISTTYITLFFITICIIAFQFAIIPLFNWAELLNAPTEMNPELTRLVTWVVFLFSLQFLFKLITSIMLALQMPAFSSLVVTLGQLSAFIAVLCLVKLNLEPSLLLLGIVISSAPVIVLFLSSIIIFSGKYRIYAPSFSHYDKALIESVLSLGSKFFLIQLTALFLFQANNIIIAHTGGPADVTEFNIAYKYIGLIHMAFAIIAMPFWSATTEAFSKNDINWIRKSLKSLNQLWMVFTLGGILLILGSEFIYQLWIGEALKVDYFILFLMLVYFSLFMRWTIYGTFLNGIGKIRLQFYITLLEAIIHIPLAYYFGVLWGIPGVLFSMILVAAINVLWPPIQLKKIITGIASGLWNK